jgi:hypothetical protein
VQTRDAGLLSRITCFIDRIYAVEGFGEAILPVKPLLTLPATTPRGYPAVAGSVREIDLGRPQALQTPAELVTA